MAEPETQAPAPAPWPVFDLNQAVLGFADEVAREPGGAHIRRCYACGACSARCPVADHLAGFDPRRLIRLILLGQRDPVLQSPLPWRCSTCYTCQETCPQGVGFTEVLFAVKNIAARAGFFPPALGLQPDILRAHGRLLEITDFENKNRADLGLPAITERPAHYQAMLARFSLKTGEEA
jgi:heterodisulfide reductase subunit C